MKNPLLLLLSMVLFFASCKKEELLTDRIDFTNEDIANIIKMNFLEEHGGILMEKDYIYNLSRNHDFSQQVAETISEDIDGDDSAYYITMKGEYSNDFRRALSVYNNRFISYISNGSKGRTILDKFELDLETFTRIDIAGNVEDNKYVFSIVASRNFEFLKGLNENHFIGGNISFYSGACVFDYNQNVLTPKVEFFTEFYFYNQKVLDDRIDIKGKIIREQSNWVFINDDGTRLVL